MGEANILRLLGVAEIRNGFAIGKLNVGVGRILEVGTAKPADNTVGYCPGAHFIISNAVAGANQQVYINEGTKAACNFQFLTT